MLMARSIDYEISLIVSMLRYSPRVLITAGSGMSADSGIPVYRPRCYSQQSLDGFFFDSRKPDTGPWHQQGFSSDDENKYRSVTNPQVFDDFPSVAWGYAALQLSRFQETGPHSGYTNLLLALSDLSVDYFVFTTNVDGFFVRAGFDPDRIVERHGNMHWIQCAGGCHTLWCLDSSKLRFTGSDEPVLLSDPPLCPRCAAGARPNVFMFSDNAWNKTRYRSQLSRYEQWRRANPSPVVLELGVGDAIPTASDESSTSSNLVFRVNPDADSNRFGVTQVSMTAEYFCRLFLEESLLQSRSSQ
jgi:NAD-dependent SIR2 family protein deacetylase